MNLTNISSIQCEILDQYDKALRALHEVIAFDGRISEVRTAQEKVMIIRNQIAQTLADHSWCGTPPENVR